MKVKPSVIINNNIYCIIKAYVIRLPFDLQPTALLM